MASHHEYLVIGAGPAGVQMGYFFDRRGRDYLILEGGQRPGSFFETYPRHRKLISINKVYTGSADPEFNLRHDWNSLLSDGHNPLFKEFSHEFFPQAESLLAYLEAFVERHGIRVRYDAPVSRVSREGDRFVVESADGDLISCSYLVVATGVSKPYIPEIPGIELAEGYEDVSVNPADFVNQRVLIIGKGNSAFETADNLVGTAALIHLVSPKSIDMAWKTHYVGDLRAVNNNILDTYQLKSQNAVIDADTRSIKRRADGLFAVTFAYRHAEDEVEELVYDRVIRCTGFCFDASIFDASCRPELTISDRFPRLTCEWESVNQPNLYFAGTLMQSRSYRKSTSGFIHGFRYNVRLLDRILGEKNHQEPWPADAIPLEPATLSNRVLDRVNSGSDLWQQQAFLGDLLVVGPDGAAEHRSGLPLGYIREKYLDQGRHCFVTTLEFGSGGGDDPFKSARIRRDNVARAADSNFLHPAIREYRDGVMLSEHHVIEDLEARWEEEEHVMPLRGYFEQRLQAARAAASDARIPALRIVQGEAPVPAPAGASALAS
ncbi:MAG TPA: NAD(P)-binding domain-containing protein [Longimicrobiaceae bacterium]|nr:NAD(P)-binding domain-containing protein [Longimicrobiaceae bacterium]